MPADPHAPNPLVEFLRGEGRAERLLAEHHDDGRGRCAVCSTGAQTGRVRWPCSIAAAARAATTDTR